MLNQYIPAYSGARCPKVPAILAFPLRIEMNKTKICDLSPHINPKKNVRGLQA